VQQEAVLAARESVLLTTNQYKAGIVSLHQRRGGADRVAQQRARRPWW